MVIYQNGIRIRWMICLSVRKISNELSCFHVFFFTELIFIQYFITSFFIIKTKKISTFVYSHLFEQHSRGRLTLMAIYQNGIRIKLQLCNRVSILELLDVNNIILLAQGILPWLLLNFIKKMKKKNGLTNNSFDYFFVLLYSL